MCKYCDGGGSSIIKTDNPTINYHAQVSLLRYQDKYKLCVNIIEDDDKWTDEQWVVPKVGQVDANYCFHCGRNLRG